MTIVNARGELVTYSAAKDPEAFNVACLNLGLLGIIYTVSIKVEEMNTRLRVTDSFPTLDSIFQGPQAGANLKAKIMRNHSTEFFYWPFQHFMKADQNKNIWLKEWERTTEPAEDMKKYEGLPPMVDNPFFSKFQTGSRIKEIPDALHFPIGDGVTTIVDVGCAIKADSDFKNICEAVTELVEKASRSSSLTFFFISIVCSPCSNISDTMSPLSVNTTFPSPHLPCSFLLPPPPFFF